MKKADEKVPLLAATEEGFIAIEIDPPKVQVPNNQTLSIQITKLQQEFAFYIAISNIVRSPRSFYLSLFIFCTFELLFISGLVISAGIKIIDIPRAKYERDEFIKNNNFREQDKHDIGIMNYNTESNIQHTLNENHCLNHSPSIDCRFGAECHYSLNDMIKKASYLIDPRDCTFDNFEYDLSLHLFFIYHGNITSDWEKCPWSCPNKFVEQYTKNETNINSICQTPVEQAWIVAERLSQCKELAPLNLQVTHLEKIFNIVTPLSSVAAFVSLTGAVLAAIFYCFKLRLPNDDIYFAAFALNHFITTFDGFIKNSEHLRESSISLDFNVFFTTLSELKNQKELTHFVISLEKANPAFVNACALSLLCISEAFNEVCEKQARLKTVLQGSHAKNHLANLSNPFTLFSQLDKNGDLRNIIFQYAELEPVYRKRSIEMKKC